MVCLTALAFLRLKELIRDNPHRALFMMRSIFFPSGLCGPVDLVRVLWIISRQAFCVSTSALHDGNTVFLVVKQESLTIKEKKKNRKTRPPKNGTLRM